MNKVSKMLKLATKLVENHHHTLRVTLFVRLPIYLSGNVQRVGEDRTRWNNWKIRPRCLIADIQWEHSRNILSYAKYHAQSNYTQAFAGSIITAAMKNPDITNYKNEFNCMRKRGDSGRERGWMFKVTIINWNFTRRNKTQGGTILCNVASARARAGNFAGHNESDLFKLK